MELKKLVTAGLLLSLGAVAFANDWYVDPTVSDDSHDGTSPNVVSATVGPKRTLAGVMAADVGVSDGDTIWLLPGEHKEGSMNGGLNRLCITQKNLKVKSFSGNPMDTAIVGYYGTGIDHSTSYTDPDAVSCIKVAESATGCIIEGVTLRDATARRVNGGANERGGGIYDLTEDTCWAINCIFTNCCAYSGGGMNGGNAARCRFLDCTAYSSNNGAAMESSGTAEYCLFLRCDQTANARTVTGDNAVFVNCTFSGAKRAVFKGTGIRVYNSVVVGNLLSNKDSNGAISGSTLYPTNSLFGSLGTSTHLDEAETCLTDQTVAGLKFVYADSGDWRPLSSSTAATYGDAQFLRLVSLPAGYEHLDLNGRHVATEGPIAAGCCEPIVQTGPTIEFGSAMEVEGVGTFAKGEFLFPEAEPCIYRMRPVLAAGERTFAIAGTDQIYGQNHYRFPVRGDGDWVRVALAGAENSYTLTAYKATDVRYADPVRGKDTWDGTTDWEHRDEIREIGPKLTLQAACDVSTGSCPIVSAAAGFYTNAVTRIEDGGYACRRRLVVKKQILIQSEEGADRTFIVGAPDPATGGRGDDAIAGVYLHSSRFGCLQGFTITGCHTPDGTGKNFQYGAAFCSGACLAYVDDCVISNNCAYQGGATCYAIVNRSRIIDNEAYQQIARYTWSTACVYAGNRLTIGNRVNSSDAPFFDGAQCACTIDLRNALNPAGRYRISNNINLADSIVYGFLDTTTPEQGQNVLIYADPIFADADAHDYRLGALSPALDVLDYAELAALTRQTLVADVAGRILVTRNGKARLGAEWNDPLPVSVIVGVGGGAASSTGKVGTNVVLSADAVTVTATDAVRRPFLGFDVNGVLQPFVGRSVTVSPSVEAGAVTSVRAVYGTDWYVNCATGDDANNDGGAADRAKATIRAATTNAVSGDVIHVAKGTYGAAEGSQKHVVSAVLETRVVVPADVMVVGEEKETTFISGAASDEPQDDFGNGPNAIRCVYLGAGATIRGFTLTGGHTCASKDNVNDDDHRGSAVLGASAETCFVENCIVSDNASQSGTLCKTINVNCHVVDNVGTANASAGESCGWYGCIIDRNKGGETVRNPTVINSCTFGTGNSLLPGKSGSPQILYYYNTSFPVCNSVFLYGRFLGYPCMTNCLLLSSMPTEANRIANNWCDCVTVASAGAAMMNSDHTLKPDSPAIDRGDASICRDFGGGFDAFGGQRVMNGRLDIGAHEWDWRPTYAKTLGRKIRVFEASPAVSNLTDGVAIPSGELSGAIDRSGRCYFTFEIAGSGTLTAYLGDELVGMFTSGQTDAYLGEVVEGTGFRFAYEPGEGEADCAIVRNIRIPVGMMLIVR